MRQDKQSVKRRNPWKLAFISLIGLLVVAILGMWAAVQSSSSLTKSADKQVTSSSQPVLVSINKAQLNQLSSYYLGRLQKDSQNKYHFEVGDEGIVYGTLKLLGSNVDYSLTFDPKVMANGNVTLHANKLALGKFPVPISFVLLYVKQNYKLPKWVQLDPKNKLIKLDIIHMNGKHGINYRAKTIDMNGKGRFAFEIIFTASNRGELTMHKTFYQFLMTKRNPGSTDPVAEFANNAFYDQSFPKQEDEFDALSKYLEENATYLPTMEIFDSVWTEYQESF